MSPATRGLYNRKTSFVRACARRRRLFVRLCCPRHHTDVWTRLRLLAMRLRCVWAADIEAWLRWAGPRKLSLQFPSSLSALRRRKGLLEQGSSGGRAADVPAGVEPQHLALLQSSSERRRRPVSGSLAPSGYASSLPDLSSGPLWQSLLASIPSVLHAARHARLIFRS